MDCASHHTAAKQNCIDPASDTAQQVKVLVTEADHVSPVPGTHVVKDRTGSHKLPPTSTHSLSHKHTHTHINKEL